MKFEFKIPLEPTAKGRPRFTRQGFAYTPSKTREAERLLKEYLEQEFRREPLNCAVQIEVIFVIRKPKSVSKRRRFVTVRPDVDNYLKWVLDAGNDILWKDDALVVGASVAKVYGPGPCIRLKVETIGAGIDLRGIYEQ